MNPKFLSALLGIFFVAGCTNTVTLPPGASYVPVFTRVPAGYRPVLPSYYPVVSYVGCEALAPEQIREIQQDFYHPLVKSEYQNLIGALVINGASTSSGTTFTIWLLDGRRLDSGNTLPSLSPTTRLGTRFYGQALAMLQQSITPQKLQEAKSAR